VDSKPNTTTSRFILARQLLGKPFIPENLIPVKIAQDGTLVDDTAGLSLKYLIRKIAHIVDVILSIHSISDYQQHF
jgi:hypothetical protein